VNNEKLSFGEKLPVKNASAPLATLIFFAEPALAGVPTFQKLIGHDLFPHSFQLNVP
jgi:hypothetical protein